LALLFSLYWNIYNIFIFVIVFSLIIFLSKFYILFIFLRKLKDFGKKK